MIATISLVGQLGHFTDDAGRVHRCRVAQVRGAVLLVRYAGSGVTDALIDLVQFIPDP